MWNALSGSGSREARSAWTDVQLVTQAMQRLDQLEFEFFRSAWRHWYGVEPEDRAIEPGFVRYLFYQTAPTYVRHFARRILADAWPAGGEVGPDCGGLAAIDSGAEVDMATAGGALVIVLCLAVLI